MMFKHSSFKIIFAVFFLCLLAAAGHGQDAAPVQTTVLSANSSMSSSSAPGDRITYNLEQPTGLTVASVDRNVYRLAPGDAVLVGVRGRSVLDYPSQNSVTVAPTGGISLPLIGNIDASGKTLAELESVISDGLAKYFKHFTVNVSLAKIRPSYAWVSGEVSNAGLQMLPNTSTVSFAVLRAGIRPMGSSRRIVLTRDGKKQEIDLYRMLVLGDMGSDIDLQPGDSIYVPPAADYVEVRGEAIRGGRYEMVSLSKKSKGFSIRDLLQLSLGTTPSAALDKAFVERIGPDGKKIAVNVDLSNKANSLDASTVMRPGDVLVIPSISAFQPMVRLIGEFKGDGVYQRLPRASSGGEVEVYNKSGIYFLKQGQTVRDIITATGGVTPQADLKRAYIERKENGRTSKVPVDLEGLLVRSDKSADMMVVNGDVLVLPALEDSVHVFGEITKPGSYTYGPNRRLIDYIGDAGGPTQRAKLSEIRIVRGTAENPTVLRADAKHAMQGRGMDGNPVLEPGDIVYIPSKFISDWRDALQLAFTSLSLSSMIKR